MLVGGCDVFVKTIIFSIISGHINTHFWQKHIFLYHIFHFLASPNFQEFSVIFGLIYEFLRLLYMAQKTHFLQVSSHETLASSYASTKSKIRIMTVGTPDLEFVWPSYELLKIYDWKWDPRFWRFTNFLKTNFWLHHADHHKKLINFHK